MDTCTVSTEDRISQSMYAGHLSQACQIDLCISWGAGKKSALTAPVPTGKRGWRKGEGIGRRSRDGKNPGLLKIAVMTNLIYMSFQWALVCTLLAAAITFKYALYSFQLPV